MSAYTPDDILPVPQRRIRHITSLQIRNLTPFPARDALAQTLIQPPPNTSLFSQQPVDDIELTLASRRRRRVSATSISTLYNPDVEDEGGPGATVSLRQKRKNSKGSVNSSKNAVVSPGMSTSRQKARTSSKVSAAHRSLAPHLTDSENIDLSSGWDNVQLGGQFVTHSQRTLEKIVSSRLVETFITLTLPPSSMSANSSDSQPSSLPTSPAAATLSPPRKGKDVSIKRALSASVANQRRGASTSSFSTASLSRPKRPHSFASPSPNPPRTRSGSSGLASASPKVANFPSPPPTPPPRSPPNRSTPSTSARLPSSADKMSEISQLDCSPPIPTPFYISSLHPPSTNPCFSHLDPEREFAPWANPSATRFKVAIWGRDRSSGKDHEKNGKGKGKPPVLVDTHLSITEDRPLWKTLEEWEVNLDDMEPFSDVADHHLPSNTLLLTVSSGEIYRIAPVSLNAPSRVPSPLKLEYDSDGGVDEIRHRKWEREESESRRREREALEKRRRETRMKRSACWQDLVKIVNLQACIVDTKESLEEIVQNCNLLIEGDGYNAILREVSEREEWLRSLGSDLDQVKQDSTRVRHAIEARRKSLKLRRETLTAARTMHDEDLCGYTAQTRKVESERQRHATLVASLSPLRITLIQAVSFIFPIEPLSAPDLLFTILGASLPIPVSASDPAPPISLPSQSEVTEDNTATALGYVAQVVQLISAYLGKSLVYPVTCCGSRSVIKDLISAMMGPRIFPLYSKGVETYRFEYGVFLLNKDIEMFMMDRNLRAMDMRHTLPNLKNLLLTLTTDECVNQVQCNNNLPTSATKDSKSGLQLPTRAISPLAFEASQATSSGETSSKMTRSIVSRKSTPLLSPLAAILRARYPSTAVRPTVRVVDETPEQTVGGNGNVEDGATLGNNGSDDVALLDGGEHKANLKANVVNLLPINGHNTSFEKLAKSDESSLPPPTATAT